MLMLQLSSRGGLCQAETFVDGDADGADEPCVFQPCKNNCRGGIDYCVQLIAQILPVASPNFDFDYWLLPSLPC